MHISWESNIKLTRGIDQFVEVTHKQRERIWR